MRTYAAMWCLTNRSRAFPTPEPSPVFAACHTLQLPTWHHTCCSNFCVIQWYSTMPGNCRSLRDRRGKSGTRRSRRSNNRPMRRVSAKNRTITRRGGALPWLRKKPTVRKVLSQADFDHLLMSPEAVRKPDSRLISTPATLDLDIYLASPAKVKEVKR